MAELDLSRNSVLDHLDFLAPFLEQFDMGVMLIDAERHIHWVNRVMRRMEFCGQHLDPLPVNGPIEADSALCGECPLKDVCRNPGRHLYFSRQQQDHASGMVHSYSIFTHSIPQHSDQPVWYMIIVRDISEREWAFKEKQELQLMLSNVLESTVDAVITLDQKGNIHSWNRGAWQVFGYTKDEIRNKHIGILIPDDESAMSGFEEILRLLDEQGFVRNHRARMQTKEKGIIDVAVTQTTMRTLKGEPFGYSLIIRDISKVVHLEQSLFKKVMQLEKLLQLDDVIRHARSLRDIYNAILVAVTAGEGLRFNRAYLFRVDPLLGHLVGAYAVGPSSGEEAATIYSRAQERPLTLAELIKQRSELAEQTDVLVNQQIKRVEMSLRDDDNPLIRSLNENRPYLYMRGGADDEALSSLFANIDSTQFVAVPLVWQNQPLGLIVADNYINRADISMEDVQMLSTFANRVASAISNIQLQEDLHAKVEELKNAYKSLSERQEISLRQERLAALGEMSSKVAHEIRNPLSTIGGFARLIYKKGLSDENKRYIKIISDETARLERILEEVLGYVKNPSSHMKPCAINDLLEDCRLMVERQTHGNQVRFEMKLFDRLPTVNCNDYQIKQVFLNIMHNAVEATGRNGKVVVESRYENDNLVISVSDNGVGIDEKNLSQLFKPFFTTKSRGVGLGLNVSKNIIEQHGGTISVDSRQNEGTRIEIRIPPDGGQEAKHD